MTPLPFEQRFEAVVASVKDCAIFMLDAAGRVTSWNEGARLIKGYDAGEIVGKDFSIFYDSADRAVGKPRALLDAAIAEGRVEDEGWRIRKDGSRFWADVVITPLRDSAGGLQGFVKITRDLTARRDAQEKLRQSEARLRATLYSIGDGVLVTDEHGRVTRMNPAAERLTGWAEREALDRPIAEVFNIVNEDTRARALNPVDRVLAEGIVVGLANHTSLISRTGGESPIADSGAPIIGVDGQPQGAVLVFRDISTEREAADALRQSEEKLKLIIASLRDYALVVLDPEGRVTGWNPGAESIERYKEDEILGQHFSRFFTPEDVAAGKPARVLQVAVDEGRFEDEGWRIRKDGTRFWANVIVSPILDSAGGLVGFVRVTRDLTERRAIFEERLRSAQALEAVRLRDEFLSIASHELRTPLSALQLLLVSLVNHLRGGATNLMNKAERAKRMGDRLAQLVDALLDVSRLATGSLKLTLESFDLSDAVREVADRFRDSAAREGSELTVEAPVPVRGRWDRLRIEQVATNLIANAIKYAPGKPIEVSVVKEGNEARLQVRDHGPGIPEADQTRIFDRFERIASKERAGGLGLGLYVARQLVQAHGGTILASNVADGGACFVVRLPTGA
jgi:PAS domain S-box-containing protein